MVKVSVIRDILTDAGFSERTVGNEIGNLVVNIDPKVIDIMKILLTADRNFIGEDPVLQMAIDFNLMGITEQQIPQIIKSWLWNINAVRFVMSNNIPLDICTVMVPCDRTMISTLGQRLSEDFEYNDMVSDVTRIIIDKILLKEWNVPNLEKIGKMLENETNHQKIYKYLYGNREISRFMETMDSDIPDYVVNTCENLIRNRDK